MDETKSQEISGLGGNTSTPHPKGPRSRSWCFTLNNYQEQDITNLKIYFEFSQYVFQEEIGESGTKHLQGTVKFKNQKYFQEIKNKITKAHLEKCKNWKKSVEYCCKKSFPGARRWFRRVDIPVQVIDTFLEYEEREWQTELLKVLELPPDPRKIIWLWEPIGSSGKTTIAKHICLTKNAIYVSGRARDMKSAIACQKIKPEIVLVDLPRTVEGFVSYQGIEEIKNGIFFNGKYESGMVLFNNPHVIVLANFPPDEDKLSSDRWDTKRIRI